MKDAHKRKAVGRWCGARDVVRQAAHYFRYFGAQFYFLFLLPKQHALCETEAAVGHVLVKQSFYFCWFLRVPRSVASARELCEQSQRHFYICV